MAKIDDGFFWQILCEWSLIAFDFERDVGAVCGKVGWARGPPRAVASAQEAKES